jgi:hypothetical protein
MVRPERATRLVPLSDRLLAVEQWTYASQPWSRAIHWFRLWMCALRFVLRSSLQISILFVNDSLIMVVGLYFVLFVDSLAFLVWRRRSRTLDVPLVAATCLLFVFCTTHWIIQFVHFVNHLVSNITLSCKRDRDSAICTENWHRRGILHRNSRIRHRWLYSRISRLRWWFCFNIPMLYALGKELLGYYSSLTHCPRGFRYVLD